MNVALDVLAACGGRRQRHAARHEISASASTATTTAKGWMMPGLDVFVPDGPERQGLARIFSASTGTSIWHCHLPELRAYNPRHSRKGAQNSSMPASEGGGVARSSARSGKADQGGRR